MKIGTRMPGFAREVGFDGYCEWLAESGFDAVDTPTLTAQIAATCKRLGLTIGTCDARTGGLLSQDRAKSRKALSYNSKRHQQPQYRGPRHHPCSNQYQNNNHPNQLLG